MDASSPRRAGTHTRGIGAAARTRARFARSRGRRPRASREARRSRSSWVSRSGGAVHPSIGTVPGYLESGRCRAHTRCATTHTRAMCGSCAVRCSGSPGRPTLRTERALPKGGLDGQDRWKSGSGCCAALALASWHVAVHRLVLPAELPLVVPRELGAASSLGADPIAGILSVRSRKRADRCASVPLLCHVVHILSGRDRRSDEG